MNGIDKYMDVFRVLQQDKRLHSKHICLCAALLYYWLDNQCRMPFTVTRENLMKISKIGSKATYHKCIGDLKRFGYIEYIPTYNSYVGTKVRLLLNEN